MVKWLFVLLMVPGVVFGQVERVIEITGTMPEAREDGTPLQADEQISLRVYGRYCDGSEKVFDAPGFPVEDRVAITAVPCRIDYAVTAVDGFGLESAPATAGLDVSIAPPGAPGSVEVRVKVTVVVDVQ